MTTIKILHLLEKVEDDPFDPEESAAAAEGARVLAAAVVVSSAVTDRGKNARVFAS